MTPPPGRGTPSPPYGAAVWARVRAAGPRGGAPTLGSALCVFVRALRLGCASCPPDQGDRGEDGDLQHDQEKEDWPKPLHEAQCRDSAHCCKASTWASSRPRWVSVGTSKVGWPRRSAHS